MQVHVGINFYMLQPLVPGLSSIQYLKQLVPTYIGSYLLYITLSDITDMQNIAGMIAATLVYNVINYLLLCTYIPTFI